MVSAVLIAALVRPLGTATWLIWRSLRATAAHLLTRDPLAERGLADAMAQFIWAPLPRLITLAAFVGVIAGVSAARVLVLYNAELLVVGAVVEAMLRQILPLMMGVFASGGVAVEIASRLGAMSLAREIDALAAMGHDPVDHALAPPVTAVLLASPIHVVTVSLVALIGAAMPLHASANIGWPTLFSIATSTMAAQALLTGLAKAFLFATIAVGVGAAVGSLPVLSPADLGRRAGQAFSAGLLLVFAAGALWAVLG